MKEENGSDEEGSEEEGSEEEGSEEESDPQIEVVYEASPEVEEGKSEADLQQIGDLTTPLPHNSIAIHREGSVDVSREGSMQIAHVGI